MNKQAKSEPEQIQFDGKTVCGLSPEDVEIIESKINQQAEEIEKLKADYHEMKKYASSAVDRETALNIRFNELVKSLEDSIDKEVDDPLGDEKHLLVRYVDIQSIISKAKGEANGKV